MIRSYGYIFFLGKKPAVDKTWLMRIISFDKQNLLWLNHNLLSPSVFIPKVKLIKINILNDKE